MSDDDLARAGTDAAGAALATSSLPARRAAHLEAAIRALTTAAHRG